MTDILAVKGSARRNGNSDTVLDAAVEAYRRNSRTEPEVDTINAARLDISPCRSCHGCWETGRCVIADQMQEIYEQCLQAKHIVISAPVYFTSVPGHLKIMIDRFQCFWVRTYRLGQRPQRRRNGMFLCVGAMDDQRFFDSASLVIKSWMAALNVRCSVARFYPGLDAPDDIRKHPEYLEDAEKAGEELCRT